MTLDNGPVSGRSHQRDRFEVVAVAAMWAVVLLGVAAVVTGDKRLLTVPVMVGLLLVAVWVLVEMTKGVLRRDDAS